MKYGDGAKNKNPTLFQASPAGKGDVRLVLYSLARRMQEKYQGQGVPSALLVYISLRSGLEI